MKNSKILVGFFLLSIVLKAQTARNVDNQTLIWSRYINQLELSPKWVLQSELDYRNFVNPTVQNQYGFRIQVKNKFSEKLDLGGGFTFFSVTTQVPETIKAYHTPEYRWHQDVTIKQSLGKVNFSHRYQLEERWFQKTSETQLEKGTNFYLRFRYRVQAEFNLYKKETQYLKAILHDEIMFNAGKNVIKNPFDQNRVYAALQLGINLKTAIELGYMNVFQQRNTGVDYINRNTIRVSFYHKLKI